MRDQVQELDIRRSKRRKQETRQIVVEGLLTAFVVILILALHEALT